MKQWRCKQMYVQKAQNGAIQWKHKPGDVLAYSVMPPGGEEVWEELPPRFKTEEIKTALRAGQLVITKTKGAGKTTAIVHLLKEDHNYVVVVPDRDYARNVAVIYEELYGEAPRYGQIQVGSARFAYDETDKIIVEELFINKYRGPYWAATASTFGKEIVVL